MREGSNFYKRTKVAAVALVSGLVAYSTQAAPPDAPISPAQAVSLLQEGAVFEWRIEGDGLKQFPGKIQAAKKAGFHHIRVRNHWKDLSGELPLDQPFDETRVDALEAIVDEILAEGLGAVICFRGNHVMNEGKSGTKDRTYTKRYIRFWNILAERFKDKSHKLMFNLFIEPGSLGGINGEVYKKLTDEIRKTNPTRIIVYYKKGGKHEDISDEEKVKLPGDNYFADSEGVLPDSAGRYFIWDYHVLKHDMLANQWKVKQAWQWQKVNKEVMWCGAWSRMVSSEGWQNDLAANGTADAFRDFGLSSSILNVGSNTFPFEGEKYRPTMVNDLTKGISIWWNLLDNPGFDQQTEYWDASGAEIKTSGGIKESRYLSLPASKQVSQDITLALDKNGPGTYDLLGSFNSSSSYAAQMTIKLTSDAGTKEFSIAPQKLAAGKWSDVREKLALTWEGKLKKAELSVKGTSKSAISIDKLGVTQFYKEPILDVTQWPGEVDHPYHPPAKQKGAKLVSYNRVSNAQLRAGNPLFVETGKQIDELGLQIHAIIKEAFPQYKWPHKSNPKHLLAAIEQRMRKNKEIPVLKQQIKELEREQRDWCLINNKEVREKFIKAYGGLPPTVRGAEFTDIARVEATVKSSKKPKKSKSGSKSSKSDSKKKKEKPEKVSCKSAVVSNYTIENGTISFTKSSKKYTFPISKNVKILSYEGQSISLEELLKCANIEIKKTEDEKELVVQMRDATIVQVGSSKKDKKKDKKSKKDQKGKKTKK